MWSAVGILCSDLQNTYENLQHSWASQLKELLADTNASRNRGQSYDVQQVRARYDELIEVGWTQNAKESDKVLFKKTEAALLKRLDKYEDNYLMWLDNPIVPFTNNESERGLRLSKTKMKVSGQYRNISSAAYFATIRSYIETGRRQGLNPIFIITRARQGNFISLDEMMKFKNQHVN